MLNTPQIRTRAPSRSPLPFLPARPFHRPMRRRRAIKHAITFAAASAVIWCAAYQAHVIADAQAAIRCTPSAVRHHSDCTKSYPSPKRGSSVPTTSNAN